MRMLTASVQYVSVWLAAWWPNHARATALNGQYKKLAKECPLVVLDLARRGMAFDSTWDKNQHKSDFNAGKRVFWLETEAMLGITYEDLQTLRKDSEYDDH